MTEWYVEYVKNLWGDRWRRLISAPRFSSREEAEDYVLSLPKPEQNGVSYRVVYREIYEVS